MSVVIWHDLECHGYTADLALWRELAATERGPVLDVGAGTGRVALDLAAAGHDVTALDVDRELLAALESRAAARALDVAVVQADAQDFVLDRRFALILVPMQTIQLFTDRRAFLRAAKAHLRPGGLLAIAIVDELYPFDGAEEELPDPDVGDVDGWHYASQPIAVRIFEGAARIERIRSTVAPDGTTIEEPDAIELARVDAATLEREAAEAGLAPRQGRQIPPTSDHVALYPDLMNIYADRGNLLFLERRCEWRGIGFELAGAHPGDAVDPDDHDLFYLGGGQDRDQALCAQDLATVKRDAMHAAADRGAVVFAVCGGHQLLGHGYQLGDDELPGLGLVDLRTVREAGPRLIGNVAIEVELPGLEGPQVLAGFENHGGRTHLGERERPLGRVLSGYGNNGADGYEGVRRGHVIGTYLHGPLLPKNAWFADWLIATALGLEPGALAPLDDDLEAAAHAAARRAAQV
jgi:CobQ-like glutamine amidotransferase family enzyme